MSLPRGLAIGSGMTYAVAALMVAYGLLYLFIPTLLPYHQTFVEIPFESLDPKVGALFLLIYRGVGWAMIAFGVTVAMVVRGYLRKGSRWAIYTLGAGIGTALVPLVFVILQVGNHAPWWGVAGAVVFVGIALGLCWPHTR